MINTKYIILLLVNLSLSLVSMDSSQELSLVSMDSSQDRSPFAVEIVEKRPDQINIHDQYILYSTQEKKGVQFGAYRLWHNKNTFSADIKYYQQNLDVSLASIYLLQGIVEGNVAWVKDKVNQLLTNNGNKTENLISDVFKVIDSAQIDLKMHNTPLRQWVFENQSSILQMIGKAEPAAFSESIKQKIQGNWQELKSQQKETDWILYNKNSGNGVIVGIDLLLPETKWDENIRRKKNYDFEKALISCINDGSIKTFMKEDVETRTIPYDISDQTLCLFVDILRWAENTRKAKELDDQTTEKTSNSTNDSLYYSIEKRMLQESLDELVKCTNLFNDFGLFVHNIDRSNKQKLVKTKDYFLIPYIVDKINTNISLFLQISEDALADIFRTATNVYINEESMEQNYTEQLAQLGNFDVLNDLNDKKDLDSIIYNIRFNTFGGNYDTSREYFEDIIRIVEIDNTSINPSYVQWLVNIIKSYRDGCDFALSIRQKSISELISLIVWYTGQMIDERRNRENDPALWLKVGRSSVEASQTVSPVVSETSEKGMSWKQIVAILGIGSAAAYALYKYLTQQK